MSSSTPSRAFENMHAAEMPIWIKEIISAARLTPVQVVVLCLWLDGASVRDISEEFDIRANRARLLMDCTFRKLRRTVHALHVRELPQGAS